MLATLQQITVQTESTSSGGFAAGLLIFFLVYIGLIVLMAVGYWKVFTKLGMPGWMGIIPIVNIYMIFKARGQHEPIVFLILCLIPCINIIGMWFLASDTAEMFGKELGWKIFLFLLPGIAHLVLGFGSAQGDRTAIAPGVGLNAAP